MVSAQKVFILVGQVLYKNNVYTSIASVRDGMLHGHYEFGSKEYGSWWYINDQGLFKEEFYGTVQEFIDENAEHLI